MLPITKRKTYKRYFRDETAKVPLQTYRRRKRLRQELNELQRAAEHGLETSSEDTGSEDNEVDLSSEEDLLHSEQSTTPGHNLHQPMTDSDASPPSSPLLPNRCSSPTPSSTLCRSISTGSARGCTSNSSCSGISDSSLSNTASPDLQSHSDTDEYLLSSDSDDRGNVLSSDDSDDEQDIFWNRQLHDNTRVTIGEAVIDVLDLYLRHNLSKVCLDDILKLINKFLPAPHLFPGTKYKLIKLLSETENFSLVKHRFCSKCILYLGLYDETVHLINCTNCFSTEIDGMFVEIPIADTLKSLIENRQLYRYLQKKNVDTDDISDIKDGDLSEIHQVSQYPINLIWNTDGVPVFHSSNSQIWPILFTIANLPPNIRKRNISLAGLWFGHTKPVMNTFLRPIVESLSSLHQTGFSWLHPEFKTYFTSHVAAPVITVDAKARSDMQGLISCNGRYGCSFCEHEGEVVRTERSSVVIYQVVQPSPQLRDKHRMMAQAQAAIDTGESQFGVVRPSCLSLIPSVDTGKSFVPDYMHAVALGVVRQFFWLWLDSKHHREPWYIGTKKDDLDNVLLSIKPPNDMCRVPRSVAQGKHWKASEFRNWLLFYSPVCLVNILPALYFQHWLLLVASIYLLLQERITRTEISLAEHLLQLFCEEAEDLYGKRHMSFNVHQLLHLGSSVRNWGPLWATSCFMFENINGTLLSLIHGTQKVTEQIVSSTKFVQSLQMLKYQLQIEHQTDQGIQVLGSVYTGELQQSFHDTLDQYSELNGNALERQTPLIYIRVKSANLGTLTSQLYSREKVRTSYFVTFKKENSIEYGTIETFADFGNNHIVALVTAFKQNRRKAKFVHHATGCTIKQFVLVEKTNTVLVILCSNILGKVIDFGSFIGIPPNGIEKNL